MSKKTKRLELEYGESISYVEVDGSYTLMELEYSGEKKIRAFGIAKLNCNCDEFNAERGRQIAFYRAAEKLDRRIHPHRYRKAKK